MLMTWINPFFAFEILKINPLHRQSQFDAKKTFFVPLKQHFTEFSVFHLSFVQLMWYPFSFKIFPIACKQSQIVC